MSNASRRARLSIVERLTQRPQDYSFLQCVRLLERAAVFAHREKTSRVEGSLDDNDHTHAHANLPVARFSPPQSEVLRFFSMHDLNFPSSEVERIEACPERSGQWKVWVNIIGLAGAMGVLPRHYTELILKRTKLKDHTMAHFISLFEHRTTSLFFQASVKYRLPIEYERAQLYRTQNGKPSAHTQALLSLLGLGSDALQQRQALRDETLIYYSGLLTQQVKTPLGLKQIIQDYFGVPVSIDSFVGHWQTLIEDVRTRLPSKANRSGQNICLGRSAMLGRRGWFAQGKCRIKIGPLDREQFDMFAPGSSALKALNALTRSYLGITQDFDFIIEVCRADVPEKVVLSRGKPPMLAWNAWLSGKPSTNNKQDELLSIVVSSKKQH
ncbi:MAG: type VI secretion system baseplate subunit TssG [Alteromonadaceae bacterium]|nr:MAG: type VI secretion system baseplate subunit TssG [Alteromonadaceae bacterium]